MNDKIQHCGVPSNKSSYEAGSVMSKPDQATAPSDAIAIFWQCEFCGCDRMRHVRSPDRHGNLAWHNRCLDCGRDSEYLPSPEKIAFEAARLRAEKGRLETDDALERFWHSVQAEQLAYFAEADELAIDNPIEIDLAIQAATPTPAP